MSIVGTYRHVGASVLQSVIDHPDLVGAVIGYEREGGGGSELPAGARELVAALPPEKRDQVLAMLAAQLEATGARSFLAQRAASARESLRQQDVDAAQIGDRLEIEKAWAGLDALLAKTTPPPSLASRVVLGGTEVGEDLAYGPARFLTANEVAGAARDLALREDELRSAFSPGELTQAKVYGGHWDDPQELEWLLEAYRRVRDYFVEAAAKGHAMLFWLS